MTCEKLHGRGIVGEEKHGLDRERGHILIRKRVNEREQKKVRKLETLGTFLFPT